MTSKYEPLARYLEEKDLDMLRMTFQEVEDVLGELPPAARKHRAWWANNASHSHARHGWMRAGWETSKVDMDKEELLFVRAAPTPWGTSQPDFSALNLRQDARRSGSGTVEDMLVEIVRKAGGVENLNEILVVIERYVNGEIIETELGRVLRARWPR